MKSKQTKDNLVVNSTIRIKFPPKNVFGKITFFILPETYFSVKREETYTKFFTQ